MFEAAQSWQMGVEAVVHHLPRAAVQHKHEAPVMCGSQVESPRLLGRLDSPAARARKAEEPTLSEYGSLPPLPPLAVGPSATCIATSGSLRAAASCLGAFATAPCATVRFVAGLQRKFGGFVPTAIMANGVNQAMLLSFTSFAMRYYMMDVLGLDGPTMSRFGAVGKLPWCVKPCIGMLSDVQPLFGYRRAPYMLIAGLLGLVAFAWLGLLPVAVAMVVPLIVLVNLSVAIPDVVVDAATAELSKQAPESASDLQSLISGSCAVCAMLAACSKGPLLEVLGPKRMLLGMGVVPFSIIVPAAMRLLPETRLPKGRRCSPDVGLVSRHRATALLSVTMSLLAVLLSALQMLVEDFRVRGGVSLAVGILLAVAAFGTLRRITPLLAKTALVLFLKDCLQPNLGETMFVWQTKHPGGPRFSASMMGWIECMACFALLLGVTLYNKYLTRVSYRKIFAGALLSISAASILDFVLVKRWNLAIGIPDAMFVIGDDVFSAVMMKFFSIPLMVLASKVCPDNLEATLFAVLMSLSNLGACIGDFFGVTLCECFGLVRNNFDRLPEAILAKACFRLLPIPLIFILVPNMTPSDPILLQESAGKEEENPVVNEEYENNVQEVYAAEGPSDSPEEWNGCIVSGAAVVIQV